MEFLSINVAYKYFLKLSSVNEERSGKTRGGEKRLERSFKKL